MHMNRHPTRLQALSEHNGSLPMAPRVVDQAFATFRESGELPDQQRLAAVVIERALLVAKLNEPQIDLETGLACLDLVPQVARFRMPRTGPKARPQAAAPGGDHA